MQWDFWTLSPETAHQVAVLMSDRGTPRSYRHMNGYSSHTYSWMNAKGERFWVKYHFKTVQGIENFTLAEADAMVTEDPDFLRRDLWEAIAAGHAAEWRLEMQIMPFEDAAGYRFNPFDLTKVWPHADYPPITIGRMVLDRNPENHFAEVEQAGFAPSRLVPGIGLSPDKMLMGRVFSYHDTHLHRIGPNYEQLPINAPRCPVHSYSKDGAMNFHHSGAQPVYYPNSKGGPVADPSKELPTWWVEAGEIGRYAYERHANDSDFVQPGVLYREVMSDTDREHLVSNIVAHASDGVSPGIQERVIGYWRNVDAGLGAAVAAGLGHGNGTGPDTLQSFRAPVPD
jgi:catalase